MNSRSFLLLAFLVAQFSGCGNRSIPQPKDLAVHAYDVELTEYAIVTSDSLAAGPAVFHVVNHGLDSHNIVISGNGINKSFTRSLMPDESRSMSLDLPKGRYELFCPINHDAEKGMHLWIDAK